MVDITFKTKAEIEAILDAVTVTADPRIFKQASTSHFFAGVNGLPKYKKDYYQTDIGSDETAAFNKMVVACDQMELTGTWPTP